MTSAFEGGGLGGTDDGGGGVLADAVALEDLDGGEAGTGEELGVLDAGEGAGDAAVSPTSLARSSQRTPPAGCQSCSRCWPTTTGSGSSTSSTWPGRSARPRSPTAWGPASSRSPTSCSVSPTSGSCTPAARASVSSTRSSTPASPGSAASRGLWPSPLRHHHTRANAAISQQRKLGVFLGGTWSSRLSALATWCCVSVLGESRMLRGAVASGSVRCRSWERLRVVQGLGWR